MSDSSKRRGNARAAKRAQRAAGSAARPVRPGLIGGQYRPLSDADMQRIHAAVLQVLERTGIGTPPAAFVALAEQKGCWLDDDGRLRFPPALVEDVLAGAARSLVLHGRDPAHDLQLDGQRVHYGTGGAAVKTLDWHSGRYRAATLTDLYDFARLVDRLDNVHWFTRCVIATEIEDWLALDLNTAYACLAGTQKHLGTAITVAQNVAPVIALFDAVLGGEGAFARRPICKLHASPMISPLRYGEDACDTMLAAMRHNMPINAITAGQAGATAPATLAGALVQTIAETLGALIFVNLFRPGYPMIFSNWPMISDLRSGAFSGGGGEEALISAAAAQMSHFYGLPGGVAAGMSDSKLPDAQAGYEKGISNVLAGLAGANMIYESAGMMGSLLGCSFEAFAIDDELIGAALRAVRGIEVNDQTLAVQQIDEAVRGPGHFLGAQQTIAVMESEYLYPALADRATPDQWQADGGGDIRQRARERVGRLLAEHYPRYIDAAIDGEIRRRFAIRLPAESMRPGGARW